MVVGTEKHGPAFPYTRQVTDVCTEKQVDDKTAAAGGPVCVVLLQQLVRCVLCVSLSTGDTKVRV